MANAQKLWETGKMDQDEIKVENSNSGEQPLSAKKQWITPEAQEFDPNAITKTGFTPTGTDFGIYS